jgi:hypothetical protein
LGRGFCSSAVLSSVDSLEGDISLGVEALDGKPGNEITQLGAEPLPGFAWVNQEIHSQREPIGGFDNTVGIAV